MNQTPTPTPSHLLRVFGALFCCSLPTAFLLALVDLFIQFKGDPVGPVLWVAVALLPALCGVAAYAILLRIAPSMKRALPAAVIATGISSIISVSVAVVWVIANAS